MHKRKAIALINLFVSGVIALFIANFFASGTIAENYTDQTYVAPEFFVVLVIWGIGALFVLWLFFKNSLLILFASIIITWASMPLGIKIGFLL